MLAKTSRERRGTRRLHRTWSGECFVLNERGEFIQKLADSGSWQMINDAGTAVRIETSYIPAANGLPAYNAPELMLSTGESIPIPHDPGISPDYSLQSFSTDGKALLVGYVKNDQFVYSTRFFLFDTATGTLARKRRLTDVWVSSGGANIAAGRQAR